MAAVDGFVKKNLMHRRRLALSDSRKAASAEIDSEPITCQNDWHLE
jgi:hypothetical protein